MKSFAIALSFAVALVATAPAQAAPPAGTEKVKLSGKKGPSLFRPGFQLGEYDGDATVKSSKSSVTGVFEGGKASVEGAPPGARFVGIAVTALSAFALLALLAPGRLRASIVDAESPAIEA